MRKLAVLAVLALSFAIVLAAGGGAAADSGGNVPIRLGQGLWFLHACNHGVPGVAACNADVVSSSSGTPLVTNPTPPPAAYGPAQLRGAYSLTGSGSSAQTIGIVDAYDAPNIEADLGVFNQQFGLPACTTANGCFRKVEPDGRHELSGGKRRLGARDRARRRDRARHLPRTARSCSSRRPRTRSRTSAPPRTRRSRSAPRSSRTRGATRVLGRTSDDSTYFNHPGVVITASTGDSGYGVECPAASPYVVGGRRHVAARERHDVGVGDRLVGRRLGLLDLGVEARLADGSGCTRRSIADVSADADPNTGAAVYDSTTYSGSRAGSRSAARASPRR